MSRYGGGCSQKIGVSIWEKNNLKIKSINGLTEDGEVLEDFTTISSRLSEPDSSKTTIDPMHSLLPKVKKIFLVEDF